MRLAKEVFDCSTPCEGGETASAPEPSRDPQQLRADAACSQEAVAHGRDFGTQGAFARHGDLGTSVEVPCRSAAPQRQQLQLFAGAA